MATARRSRAPISIASSPFSSRCKATLEQNSALRTLSFLPDEEKLIAASSSRR